MTKQELQSSTAYIDMVRNHREKAFDEGMGAMRAVVYVIMGKGAYFPFPENPYKIKEKEQENVQP